MTEVRDGVDPQPTVQDASDEGVLGDPTRRLQHISGLPLDERPEQFQTIHDQLRDALAAIDDA